MDIKNIAVKDLIPYEKNTKKHDDVQINNVAESIKQYGFVQPIVIDKNNVVVIGHCRLLAAKKLKMADVPCVCVEDLTEEQVKALRIVDNKSNESPWDFDFLADELAEIDLSDFSFDFGLDIDDEEETEIVEDEAPEVDEENEPITKLGDIWQLGRHRLMCGDSTDKATVSLLMNGNKADLYLTDPPYNVNYTDGQENERKILNDHFDTDEECGEKLWLPTFINAKEVSNDCCSVYCFMPQGGTHMMMMMMMMSKAGWQVKHELIWLKQSIVLNRADYNYQHEPFLYGWNKTHKFYGNGKFKNTSVWQIDRPTKSKEHPTMKPVELFAEILNNATKKDDVVLDTFCGSGTSFIACEQLGRTCYGMELDPKYCDVIIKRWETLTGEKAVKIN